MIEHQTTIESLLPLMEACFAEGQSFRISPGGNSMRPMLRPHEDEVVLSALPKTLKKYDLPLYRRSDGAYVLHRIIKVGETYTCIGDNQFRKECGVTREQMVAIMTEFVRNGRTYSATSLRYRIYCYLWHYTRGIRRLWKWPESYLRRIIQCLRSKH